MRCASLWLGVALGLALPLGVQAELPPDQHVFRHAEEISDAELGGMRGRFVSANSVMYFGVEMLTQWVTPQGESLSVGLNMSVNLPPQPQVSFQPTVTITQRVSMEVLDGGSPVAGPAASGGSVAGGGVENVVGIVQNIQVAGDANQVNNDVDMALEQGAVMMPEPQTGSTPITGAGTLELISGSGTVTTLKVNEGSFGYAVDVPGQGRVVQEIRGGSLDGGRGLLQSTQLVGDLNQIHNVMRINVGIDSLNGGARLNLHSALSQLNGIPTPGMF